MRCIDVHHNGQITSFCFLGSAQKWVREIGLTNYTIMCRGHNLERG